jgi:hypothetical protein
MVCCESGLDLLKTVMFASSPTNRQYIEDEDEDPSWKGKKNGEIKANPYIPWQLNAPKDLGSEV